MSNFACLNSGESQTVRLNFKFVLELSVLLCVSLLSIQTYFKYDWILFILEHSVFFVCLRGGGGVENDILDYSYLHEKNFLVCKFLYWNL